MTDANSVGAGQVEDSKGDHVIPIVGGWHRIVGKVLYEKWLRVLHDTDNLHLQSVRTYEDIPGIIGIVEGETL